LEQGRFGRHQNLQALIENWSLRNGHWQLNTATPTAQWPSRWRFQSAGSIMFDLRLQHPAAVKRQLAIACDYLRLYRYRPGLNQPQFWVFSTALAAAFLAGGWLREIHARSKRPCHKGAGLSRHSFSDGGSLAEAGQHSFFSPFALQNVKEQARERPTRATLPCFNGNAT
jgi:hypothetical protein